MSRRKTLAYPHRCTISFFLSDMKRCSCTMAMRYRVGVAVRSHGSETKRTREEERHTCTVNTKTMAELRDSLRASRLAEDVRSTCSIFKLWSKVIDKTLKLRKYEHKEYRRRNWFDWTGPRDLFVFFRLPSLRTPDFRYTGPQDSVCASVRGLLSVL